MQIDLKILELLASKICHDLVSPVGAINNGVELIADVGGGVVDEAMKLIGDSAEQASRRLRLFRLVYGRAGSEGTLTFRDMSETVQACFAGGKMKLIVGPDFPSEPLLAHRGALKVMMNIILLADEALPYGGEITLGPSDEALGFVVTASGRGVVLNEAILAAFAGDVVIDDVVPRTVHAYVAGRFASYFSFRTVVDATQSGQIAIKALLA